ncbi:MAG: SsrA-binding protein SmpB [Phycisphaerae bacterium]|nr:SsrA-binding protein SmpB [Phycisphaerae bacterium]
MASSGKKGRDGEPDPVMENRKARHDYHIGTTLECGLRLQGSEVKSFRRGQVSLNEGWVRSDTEPLGLTLMQVHVAEYGPAGARQHTAVRPRRLLAHTREIRKLSEEAKAKSGTIVPLKIYFVRGVAKVLVGVGIGKNKSDKRQDMAKKTHQRDMDRAMSKRRD